MIDFIDSNDPPNIAPNIAKISGQILADLPPGLYIPPDSLRVFLASFEGPLDLLLYLIQAQNIDILDIPIAEITLQYLEYVNLMQELNLDLAAEYLLMAAVLTEIKSRMLLPTSSVDDELVEDPRAELVRQLQEYAQLKQAATALINLPCVGRDVLPAYIEPPPLPQPIIIPDIPLTAVLYAMRGVMSRAVLFSSHQVTREPLSVRERMSTILARLQHCEQSEQIEFKHLFTLTEGRAGVVVTLLAILELAREALIKIVHTEHTEHTDVRIQKNTEIKT